MSASLPQRIVPFYGDELVAVQQADGSIFVLFAGSVKRQVLLPPTIIKRVG